MTAAETRRTISGVTLAVMGVATVVMAVWGFNALTEPVKKSASVSTTTDGCTRTPAANGTVIRRSQVTVSVYNAGKRSGRAQATLNLLENAGFRAGAVGNAPAGSNVPRVQVRTTKQDDAEARLVALAFGKNTPVTVTGDDFGPGIDIFIGDKFKKLDKAAPKLTRVGAVDNTCS